MNISESTTGAGFRLADLTGIQIAQATSGIYKEAFSERVYITNLNDLLLKDKRFGELLLSPLF